MQPTYHFVSHSHWDREWYKTFETFRLDLVDMINTLLELLQSDPDFRHFTLDGQTIVLEDYAEIMPARVAELRELIQAERVAIGPWYVLPDEFLVSAESTVRNLLHGTKAAAAYGPVMPVGYIPDSFGHLAMLPAILRGFDMDTAIVWRGFGGEPGQEKSEYRWRAPDGSEVLMIHLPPDGYSEAYFGTAAETAIIEKARALAATLEQRGTTSQHLCLNGGDHHFPEPNLPRALLLASEQGIGRFIHSSIPEFVRALKDELKARQISLSLVEGELRWGYRYAFAVQSGVYSSRMYLKQANHRCENLLARYAEPLAIWAEQAGRSHLAAMMQQAWKLLLQNHPHDSICGCSIDAVHREMMTRFEKCTQIGEAVIEKSLKQLYPDDWEGSEHVLVFNPHCRTLDHSVAAEVEFFRQQIIVGLNPNVHPAPPAPLIAGFRLLDIAGREVPYQILRHEPEAHGLRYNDYSYPSKRLAERFQVLLEARQIPGLGFQRYRIETTTHFPAYASDLQMSERVLENTFLRVEIQQNGSIVLYDKRNQQEFRGLHCFEDGGDAGDEYNYSYPLEDTIITSQSAKVEVDLIESGPLRAAWRLRLQLELPASLESSNRRRAQQRVTLPIESHIYLYHDQPRLEFETRIENNAQDHRLRVLFPSGCATNRTIADSQFCLVSRQHAPVDPGEFKIEVPSAVHPMQRGVTVLDDSRGLTIATAGLPEYELQLDENRTVAITLLRCVGRLSGGDLLTRPGGESGWITYAPEAQCLSSHTFRYAVIPHSADEFHRYDIINEQIEAFRLPLRAFRRGGEPVKSMPSFHFELSPSCLILSAFKPAENGRGSVMRCYNPTQREIAASLSTGLPLREAWQTQLNERKLHELPIRHDRSVEFSILPNQILSMLLFFDELA